MKRLITSLSHPIIRSLLSALIGFFAYGAWAYWINIPAGSMIALKAAVAQGAFSFAMTLLLNIFMEYSYRKLSYSMRSKIAACLVTAITCCLLYIMSFSLHVVAETPMILFTILPGAIISTVYSIVYMMGVYYADKP